MTPSFILALGVLLAPGGIPLPKHGGCLSAPLDDKLIVTMPFRGNNYPFEKIYGPHNGADFEALVGTKVLASAAGVVVWAGAVRNGANVVDISLPKGLKIRYGHLSKIRVKRGQRVRRGQFIGLSGGAVGAKGSGPITNGPHLHFELISDGARIDPVPHFCPNAVP